MFMKGEQLTLRSKAEGVKVQIPVATPSGSKGPTCEYLEFG